MVVVPLPLPWVTLTQHDDDGDCPSIAAVAATTVFVQHRETSERRPHTHRKSCRERGKTDRDEGKEREEGRGETDRDDEKE